MDMFNNKFRVRLSLIVLPLPSLICSSKVRIEWILVSLPILVSTPRQCRIMAQNAVTYIDTNACSWFLGIDRSSLVMF